MALFNTCIPRFLEPVAGEDGVVPEIGEVANQFLGDEDFDPVWADIPKLDGEDDLMGREDGYNAFYSFCADLGHVDSRLVTRIANWELDTPLERPESNICDFFKNDQLSDVTLTDTRSKATYR